MIISSYKGGSSVILPKHKDIDIFNYYETKEEALEELRQCNDHSVDYHFLHYEKRLHIFIGCYAYPFMEHISGQEITEFKLFNICEHKEEYKKVADFFIKHAENIDKRWYHLVIACFMFQNGKNEITEEQKEIAQSVHDNGISDKLKKFIKKTLE